MSGKKATETGKTSASGVKYKEYCYDIALLFGGPEFKAQVCWLEEVCFCPTIMTESLLTLLACLGGGKTVF